MTRWRPPSLLLRDRVLGCVGLAIFGHRKILDIGFVLCALGVAAIFWRNHRRIQRLRREAPVLPASRMRVERRSRGHPGEPAHPGDLDEPPAAWQ